jgi:hypothetical protein
MAMISPYARMAIIELVNANCAPAASAGDFERIGVSLRNVAASRQKPPSFAGGCLS